MKGLEIPASEIGHQTKTLSSAASGVFSTSSVQKPSQSLFGQIFFCVLNDIIFFKIRRTVECVMLFFLATRRDDALTRFLMLSNTFLAIFYYFNGEFCYIFIFKQLVYLILLPLSNELINALAKIKLINQFLLPSCTNVSIKRKIY
jgi:hypothetical protein